MYAQGIKFDAHVVFSTWALFRLCGHIGSRRPQVPIKGNLAHAFYACLTNIVGLTSYQTKQMKTQR